MSQNTSLISSTLLPPIRTNLQVLPLEDLDWSMFEELCLKLVQKEFSIYDSERFGKPGQNQQGIDIFARHNDGFYSVYQCKKYKRFTTDDLVKAISKFRNGKYASKSKKLYICTACELNDVKVQTALEEYKTLLKSNNIELIKWDKIQLSSLLKSYPDIVYDVLGAEYVKAFNGEEVFAQLFNISENEINHSFELASADLLNINNNFTNLSDSHIERKETSELRNWIYKELNKDETNIAILTGGAGTGKTVVLKDLLSQLHENNTPVLGLKSDRKQILENELGKSILDLDANLFQVFEKILINNKVAVVLVDQIDALSQSLSTNRQQIKAYGTLVNKLSSFKNIRIIISCRSFDLNHDPELKQYTNKKIVNLTVLSDKEVGSVLKKLTGKEFNVFPKDLIKLLQTPLHLDVFCQIYSESTALNEIKNLQDLYRVLWNTKIKEFNSNKILTSENLESALYQIAVSIYENQENLSVPIELFDRFYNEIKYLRSENLLVENNTSIQFFHQTFYDYTFSRNFVEKQGGDIYNFLNTQKHQGLFLRGILKQVISYLRLYNPKQYIQQLNKVVLSPDIRFHLKLLIVEQLANEENPKNDEFKLIIHLLKHDLILGQAFLNSIPGIKWFLFFQKHSEILLGIFNNGDELTKDITSRFIVLSGDHDIEAAINFIGRIGYKDKRISLYKWILFRCKDFGNPLVTSTYYSKLDGNIQNESELFHIFSNAIKSNPDFAIKEVNKIFQGILADWNKKSKRELGHNSEESELYKFCDSLQKETPDKAYPFLKDVIISLIDKTRFEIPIFYKELKILVEDSAFQDYYPDMYPHHKLLDWVRDYLITESDNNIEFVKKELKDYLSSDIATLFFVALQVMVKKPILFLDEIFILLTNQKLVEDFFQIKELKYHYRELINVTYPELDAKRRNEFNAFALSYYPHRDFLFQNKYIEERKKHGTLYRSNYPYPYWGYDQWLILHSIPGVYVKQDKSLRHTRYMFDRRYPKWDFKNEKPHHGVTMASFRGGLMSIDNYEKLTDHQWISSFVKLEKRDHFYRMDKNFSHEGHAQGFRDVIKKNPAKYFPLVKKIIVDNNVHIRYLLGGFEGLVEGKYKINETRSLYSLLMNQEIPEYYSHSFIRLSKYFIAEECIDSELINFWKAYLALPLKSNEVSYSINGKEEERNDKLFNQGWNSSNAEALEMIVRLSGLKQYSNEVFQYLLDICDTLPIQLKLVVLYHINNGCGFKIDELLCLFLAYSKERSSEIYFVASNLINNLFYEKFEHLIPFVKDTLNMSLVATSLGRYLLYGWFYGYKQSKDLLIELHQLQSKSITETIDQACRYLNNPEFHDKCVDILKLYKDDKRKEVRDGYSQGFYKLEPSDFLHVSEIINCYVSDLDEDRLFNLYYYLERCANNYPFECIKIIQKIDYNKTLKTRRENQEPIKLLILCYNSIREYDIAEGNLEYAMNVFDDLLKFNHINSGVDEILKELDA